MTPGVAGVLLAAGRGERMQAAASPDLRGVPKLLVPLAGKPLCRHAAEALAGAGDPLRLAVVPPGEGGARVQAALAGLGYRCVTNPQPQRGLLSSFRVAVAALPPGLDGAVFALADMPLVSLKTHAALRGAAHRAQAAQCLYGEVGAPPLWLHADLWPALLTLPEADAGPRALLRGPDVMRVPRPVAELLDIDTPQALAEAEATLGRAWLRRER
ncbi:MAG: nucleotidyltransferase family protein [Deinococcus sp.]|nr:nucleotidyltransferase family protein [Deinococcus sp.]